MHGTLVYFHFRLQLRQAGVLASIREHIDNGKRPVEHLDLVWGFRLTIRHRSAHYENLNGLSRPQNHWFTPLARKPPSTTRVIPVTKPAESEARKTAAPPRSSGLPKRFI